MQVAPEIFKAYDIRGIVGKTLTAPVVRAIGQALGTLARERGATRSPSAATAGCPVPSSPARSPTAFAPRASTSSTSAWWRRRCRTSPPHHLGTGCSVMVTGSHNPPDYNGLKMVIAGDTLSGDDIQASARGSSAASSPRGSGDYRTAGHRARRTSSRIVGDVKLARPMKIAVDCGNGVAGAYAPELFARMGCDVAVVLRGGRTLPQPPS